MDRDLDRHLKAYEGSNEYDFDNALMLKWYAQRIIELSGEASSLLELGLGHGLTTSIFSKRFTRHVVLDGSLAVVECFKKKFPDCSAQIFHTYFEEFAGDETFDVVVLGFVLEHVDDPAQILIQFKRFLAPNGKIFIAVPNAEVMNRRLGCLAGMLSNVHELSENDRLLGHKRFYTIDSLTDEVRNAGYSIARTEGIYLKPFTSQQLKSLNLSEKVFEALCQMGVSYPELSCGILMQLVVSG